MSFAAPRFSRHASPADALGAAMGTSAVLLNPPLDERSVKEWKNIPPVIQEAFLQLSAFTQSLAHATQTTAVALTKKANAADLGEALSTKASNEQITELARFVQKDLMTRLDGPCSSHMQATKGLTQANLKLSELQAVVSAQDSVINRLQRQIAELQEQRESDLKSVSSAVAKHVETSIQAALATMATRDEMQQALSRKVDQSSLELVARDLQTLDGEIRARVTREEVASLIDDKVESSLAATATGIKNSTQAITDGCMRSVAELRRAVRSISLSFTSTPAAAGPSFPSSGLGAEDGVVPFASAVAAPPSAPVTPATARAEKNKLALLSASFESKLEKSKKEVMTETKKLLESQLSEVVDTLNRKAFKSDVLKAVAMKADTTDVNLMLSAKADKTDMNAKFKGKADTSELLAVRRTINDMALASSETTSQQASASSLADSALLSEVRSDLSALRSRVQQLEKSEQALAASSRLSSSSSAAADDETTAAVTELKRSLEQLSGRVAEAEKTAHYSLMVASKAGEDAAASAAASSSSSFSPAGAPAKTATPLASARGKNPLFVSPSGDGSAFSPAAKGPVTPATVASLLSAKPEAVLVAAGLEDKLAALSEEVESMKQKLLALSTASAGAPAASSVGAALMGGGANGRLRPYSSPARGAAGGNNNNNSSGSSTPAAMITPPRSSAKPPSSAMAKTGSSSSSSSSSSLSAASSASAAALSALLGSDTEPSSSLLSALQRQVQLNSAKVDTVVTEIGALTALSAEVREFSSLFSSALNGLKTKTEKLEKMTLQASNSAASATNAMTIVSEQSNVLAALDAKMSQALEETAKRIERQQQGQSAAEEKLQRLGRQLEEEQDRQDGYRSELQVRIRQLEKELVGLQSQVESGISASASSAMTATRAAAPAPVTAGPPAAPPSVPSSAMVPASSVAPQPHQSQPQQQPLPVIRGRWVWKSRQLDSEDGASVLFDVEALNTTTTATAAPALLWGGKDMGALTLPKDLASVASSLRRSDILAVKGGLYELRMAFFSPAIPPIVTVLVNGRPVLSTTGATVVARDLRERLSFVASGSGEEGFLGGLDEDEEGRRASAEEDDDDAMVTSGSVVLHRHHPSGSIGGLSMVQFLALPPKAVLSVLYDDGGNGGSSNDKNNGLLSLSGIARGGAAGGGGDASTNGSLLLNGAAAGGAGAGEAMRGQGFIELTKL